MPLTITLRRPLPHHIYDRTFCPQIMFKPCGTRASVQPPYLRWNQPVVDRQLSRREIRLLIKDIFNERVLFCASRPQDDTLSLADYLAVYLDGRFADEVRIVWPWLMTKMQKGIWLTLFFWPRLSS